MAEPPSLEELARRAVAGERDAVSGLLRALQGDVYGLALRILWQREDAEDATQEILIRVITRLSQFDFRSAARQGVRRLSELCQQALVVPGGPIAGAERRTGAVGARTSPSEPPS